MSDQNQNNSTSTNANIADPYEAERLAAVDELVRNVEAGSNVRVTPRSHHVSVNLATDTTPVDGLAEERIADDDSRNIDAEVRAWQTRLDAAYAELDAKEYDVTTGEPRYVLRGEAREIALRRYDSMAASAAYDAERLAVMQAQRAEREAQRQREQEAELLGQAWSGGDPAKRAILDEELKRADAAHVAQLIIRARGGR
jgi:hypothetical protein